MRRKRFHMRAMANTAEEAALAAEDTTLSTEEAALADKGAEPARVSAKLGEEAKLAGEEAVLMGEEAALRPRNGISTSMTGTVFRIGARVVIGIFSRETRRLRLENQWFHGARMRNTSAHFSSAR